jgi:hypothetical protein
MGREVMDGLGLTGYEDGRNPAQLALEWGVRRLGERLELRTRAGQRKPVTADFFPAYDDDGGLLGRDHAAFVAASSLQTHACNSSNARGTPRAPELCVCGALVDAAE